MANIYVSTAVAIKTVKQMFYLIAEHKPGYTHNYAFIDFKQWLTLTFPDWNHWLFFLSKKNLIWTPADW